MSLFIFKNLCSQQPFKFQRYAPIGSAVTVKIACGSYKLFPEVCQTRSNEERRAKSCCHRENCYFLERLFLSTSLVQKERSYHLHNNCQKTSWTFKNCSLKFVILANMRKIVRIILFHWKICLLFSKTCVFNNLLGPRNTLL